MSEERGEELGEVRAKALEASGELEARAAEVLELAKRIEELTDGTPGWYPGMKDEGGGSRGAAPGASARTRPGGLGREHARG